MSCRPWWIAFVVLALVIGLVAGYSFAPFTTSTLTASTPSTPVTVAYSVPLTVSTACSAPAACCAASESTSCCCSKGTTCCCSKSPAEPPKQYVHFLIKDIEVKTADATFTLGKVSFMYKGDGIEADVAKTALGADTSKVAKSVDLSDLTELLTKLMTTKASADKDAPEPKACSALPSCAPVPCSAMSSYTATCTEEVLPAPKACEPPSCTACPSGYCPTAVKVEGCETEDNTPEQVEEAEPEMLPAPTETPTEDRIDD